MPVPAQPVTTSSLDLAPLGHAAAWPAPGKLNLFLHVVGRRPDGYHDLQTAFQFIDLQDSLCFYRRPPGSLERLGDVPGVAPQDDLVIRAARLLTARLQPPDSAGVAVEVRKCLPMGGGVGGGSSDAATTLVALNELWGLQLPVDELAALGLQLGADVPVFVRGHAAFAGGVGERLTPAHFPEPVYVLIQPDTTVSTAEVFKAPELTRDSPVLKIAGLLASGEGRNDFEPVVRKRFAKVAAALDWLGGHAPARLTGTGACVFAAMPDEARARAVIEQLPREWQGWVTRGLNRSPLHDRLQIERQEGRGMTATAE
jgi:4-diphosphocytidyl-2-C-methyl-D-erythritol kinase